MKKKLNILFLGNGVYLKHLLKKYNKENFNRYLIDFKVSRSNSRTFKKTFKLDLREKKKIFNLAKKLKINAVITNQNDYGIITYGYLCSKLKLPGISYLISRRFTDKSINRIYLNRKKNIKKYIPNFFLDHRKVSKNRNLIKDLIIKPTNLQGSKNVFKLNNKNFIEKIKFFKKTKQKFILEKYINGTNYAVESLVCNKKILNLCISQKSNFPFSFINEKIIIQSSWESKLKKKIIGVNNLIIKSLGLRNGLTHLEFKVNKKKQIFLMEAACRGAGSGISNIIIPYLTGVDTDHFLYLLSMGKLKKFKFNFKSNKKKCILKWVYPNQSISQKIIKSRKNLFYRKKKITRIFKVQQSTDRGGYYINIA